MDFKSKIKTIEWIKEKNVSRMVDQLVIPYEYKMVEIASSDDMYDAIMNGIGFSIGDHAHPAKMLIPIWIY